MGTWADMVGVIRAIDVKTVAASCVRSTGRDMLDLNRRQMMEGKGSSKNIGRYRSKDYARFKADLSPLAGLGNVDLRLTGSFQSKMTLSVSGIEFEIDSTDSKAGALVEKYGGQIFGLNAKSTDEYTPILQAEFMRMVEQATGLKFA